MTENNSNGLIPIHTGSLFYAKGLIEGILASSDTVQPTEAKALEAVRDIIESTIYSVPVDAETESRVANE